MLKYMSAFRTPAPKPGAGILPPAPSIVRAPRSLNYDVTWSRVEERKRLRFHSTDPIRGCSRGRGRETLEKKEIIDGESRKL